MPDLGPNCLQIKIMYQQITLASKELTLIYIYMTLPVSSLFGCMNKMKLSGTLSECQTAWIHIVSDIVVFREKD